MAAHKSTGTKEQAPTPERPLTNLEAFVQYQAQEAGQELWLTRRFDHTGTINPAGTEIKYTLGSDQMEFCTIVADPDGTILHFEFNFDKGIGVSPVPFLIAVIDFLTAERFGSQQPASSTPDDQVGID